MAIAYHHDTVLRPRPPAVPPTLTEDAVSAGGGLPTWSLVRRSARPFPMLTSPPCRALLLRPLFFPASQASTVIKSAFKGFTFRRGASSRRRRPGCRVTCACVLVFSWTVPPPDDRPRSSLFLAAEISTILRRNRIRRALENAMRLPRSALGFAGEDASASAR